MIARIRLIGSDHTSHPHGTVLPVAPDAVVGAGANAVTLARAEELVGLGRAEWVWPSAPAVSEATEATEE
jgi:hypothetical protein